MALYEDRVAENILEEELAMLPEDANRLEGGIIYTALQANAEKIEDVYIDLETQCDNLAADKMDREHLIRRAAERGLSPKPATAAVYLLEVNSECELTIGDRFACEAYTFVLTDGIEETHAYKAFCEQSGSGANNLLGKEIEYLGYNENFESAKFIEILVYARDEEETEDFRQRYFDDVQNKTFAGNVASYIKEMNSVDGVGAAKIDVTYEGTGIKGVIMSNDYGIASEALIADVQNYIDPETDINNFGKEYGLPKLEEYKGKGYGIAPIDHSVLICSVKGVEIEIQMSASMAAGYTWEGIKERVESVIENYFNSLRKSWQKTPYITVRASQIIGRVVNMEGIEDVTNVMVNNLESVTLEFDEIPIKGGITVV